jgi:hypothetical protein
VLRYYSGTRATSTATFSRQWRNEARQHHGRACAMVADQVRWQSGDWRAVVCSWPERRWWRALVLGNTGGVETVAGGGGVDREWERERG